MHNSLRAWCPHFTQPNLRIYCLPCEWCFTCQSFKAMFEQIVSQRGIMSTKISNCWWKIIKIGATNLNGSNNLVLSGTRGDLPAECPTFREVQLSLRQTFFCFSVFLCCKFQIQNSSREARKRKENGSENICAYHSLSSHVLFGVVGKVWWTCNCRLQKTTSIIGCTGN